MTSTTHFPTETAGTDQSVPFTYPPIAPADDERKNDSPDFNPPSTEASPYSGVSGVSAVSPANEKTRTPLLPAAIWGIAAAGIALGCRYKSDMIGDAFVYGAQQAADALSESGLFGNLSFHTAFLQAAAGIILLILLWGCGMCAVGQPGVFALILVRGIGVGCAAAAVWESEVPQEQLLTLLPQALTLTLLVWGGCCAVRMGNSIFSQLTTGKRGKTSALSYTLQMGLAAIGVAAVWAGAWLLSSSGI